MSLEIYTLTGTTDFSDHIVTFSFTEPDKAYRFARDAYKLTDAHLWELKKKGVTRFKRDDVFTEETWRLNTTQLNATGVSVGSCRDGIKI